MRIVLPVLIVLLATLAACAVEPAVSVDTQEVCQSDRDCTHILPTCADIGCPYAPSAVSWTWIRCPVTQNACWCWSPVTNDEAWQCQQF